MDPIIIIIIELLSRKAEDTNAQEPDSAND